MDCVCVVGCTRRSGYLVSVKNLFFLLRGNVFSQELRLKRFSALMDESHTPLRLCTLLYGQDGVTW